MAAGTLPLFFVGLCCVTASSGQIIPDNNGTNPVVKAVHRHDHHKNRVMKHDLLSRLFSQYDKTVLPSAANGNEGLPTPITVNLLVRDGSVNDEHEEFSTTVTLRLNWTDTRLAYEGSSKHPYLPVYDGNRLWTPDIFFKDERKAQFHHVLTPNVLYRIYPDGTITMSSRLSLVLQCHMNFAWVPFDRQICEIRMASYGHTTSEVNLQWKADSPVEGFNLSKRKYHLEKVKTGCSTDIVPTGEYRTLTVKLTFQRIIGPYIVHYFIPTAVLVVITWLAFWLSPDVVTPRILLGLISLVGLYFLETSTAKDTAITPSGIALAVWEQFCATLMVLSILETVLSNYWNARDRQVYKSLMKDFDEVTITSSPSMTPLLTAGMTLTGNSMLIRRGDRLDAICRSIFPLLFIVFSAVYWTVCLCG